MVHHSETSTPSSSSTKDAKLQSRTSSALTQTLSTLSSSTQSRYQVTTSSTASSPFLDLLTVPFQALLVLLLTHAIHYAVQCIGELYEVTSGRRARSRFQIAAGFPWVRVGIGLAMMVAWHALLGRLVVKAWGRQGVLRGR
ncbi:uncharacterized protein EI97DRAFT_171038 [Westerdykella ornata]|uniref:Uncharacterized protein n=1 Tax=Westerdykella ornata TaxID=318751 RepID=A0A6A6JW31_WESOR|nr:uncharacterized protein EI97DRAFT_171038 [Westerdykella ornata]KAF2279259.1 hypothetical protein EI97DRAFT_171038 [Westerdykella ornata]